MAYDVLGMMSTLLPQISGAQQANATEKGCDLWVKKVKQMIYIAVLCNPPGSGVSTVYWLGWLVRCITGFYPRVIAIATCLSVCLSHAGIVSKRRKLAS